MTSLDDEMHSVGGKLEMPHAIGRPDMSVLIFVVSMMRRVRAMPSKSASF